MNRVYRLVWSLSLGMFVPKTELARSHKKTKRAGTALIGLIAALFATSAASATTFIDFNNGLSDWTTGGSVTLSNTTVTVPTGGTTFTLTPAQGYDMARINAPNGGTLLSPNATLGLGASSLENFLNNSDGSITNFGLLTKSFSFNPGTYTFAWAYGAEDYQPYNDGAVFTLSGNGSQSLVSLARNGSNPSDVSGPSPNTLILGSYGATPWMTMSFNIVSAGTYQVGFAVYNWMDKSLAPNLYISGIAGTYSGTPVDVSGGTITPTVIGDTGGNVTDSVFDPASPAYSGTTLTFAGGTLQYGSDMTTSKDATLTGAGGAIDTNGYNIDYSGVISGGSDFFKEGSGTLTLSGTNTYTGTTTINGGTLKLIGTGAIDGSSGVVNNGTLDLSGTTTGTSIKTLSGTGTVELGTQSLTITAASGSYDGGFEGGGPLNISGGTLTLGGTSTNTGGTSVTNNAKLIILKDEALGGPTNVITLNDGALANSATLSISHDVVIEGTSAFETAPDTSITAAGKLSGAGTLVKSGSGSLVLANDNRSYGQADQPAQIIVTDGVLVLANENGLGNAGVHLSGGSLQALTNATVNVDMSVASSTAIWIAPEKALTINSTIASTGTGDACFEKTGTGTLIMGGRADISAGTCVQEGKLYANGELNSKVTVQTAGVLRGTGLIQGDAVVNGRLAPGNSPGTLQVAGNVTMTTGSTYQEDINGLGIGHGPGNYSRLIITGAANQFVATGATLEPNLMNITGTDTYTPYAPKVGDTFRIVTAEGGIVGRFAAVTQPDGLEANTRIETYYDVGNSRSIDLVIAPTSFRDYVEEHAGNQNAQAAAGAIDTLVVAKEAGTITPTQDALVYTVTTQPSIPTVSAALAGEVHGALAAAAPLATRWLTDSVGRQLGYGHQPSDGTGLWVDTGANRSDWKSDSAASGFDTSRSQIAVGWEPLSTESARLGVGFTHGKVDVRDAFGSGSITQDLGFVYGQFRAGRVVLEGLGSIGSSDWETSRMDPLSPATTLSTDFGGHDSAITVGARIPLDTQGLALSPYARVTAERLSRDAFDEGIDSIVALSSADRVSHGTRTMAGLTGGSREQRPTATPFTYQFDVGIGRDSKGLAQPSSEVTLVGTSAVVTTPDVGRTFGFARVGGTARLTSWLYGYLGLSAETRSGKTEDVGANLGIRAMF